MSWKGNYWGTDGALEVARKCFSNSNKAGSDHVAYASELYAAGGRAFAELRISFRRRDVFGACLWSWRMLTCGYQSVAHIDTAWKGYRTITYIQYSNIRHVWEEYNRTLDEVDVSFAVWLKFGALRFGRRQRVRSLILVPLNVAISGFREVKPHTRAFIVSHAFTSGYWKRTPEWICFIEQMARQTFLDHDIGQASRVWKHASEHWEKLPGNEWRAFMTYLLARHLATASSPDQVVKLSP